MLNVQLEYGCLENQISSTYDLKEDFISPSPYASMSKNQNANVALACLNASSGEVMSPIKQFMIT